jgi:hypothetical protein
LPTLEKRARAGQFGARVDAFHQQIAVALRARLHHGRVRRAAEDRLFVVRELRDTAHAAVMHEVGEHVGALRVADRLVVALEEQVHLHPDRIQNHAVEIESDRADRVERDRGRHRVTP